ncbi:SIR2 family protein [Pseudomonas proteolytica]|uniref:SIR2 family protein n=1 Tax=Pseudomonas proteolytica TaxID=219574 RepID=UPI0030D93423
MALLKDDVTQLAFSVYESKGVFALLLGSGLSRAAEIPTGWEITLDLVKRAALAQGIEEQSDWAAWYRETTGEEPNYSTLLEKLASSPDERRAIMHRYIEPNADDREAGKKVPTAAHHAIANLVAGGFIRVIITTNFDRLMENALREKGIEPTVVSSVDALAGAEPITHSSCYILKLHGDYKDARILNTETELSGYPDQYNVLLDRILDEHGLIVSGWSGEWDHALRAAFIRAPNRRYTTYWASRGRLGSGAQELVDHRSARVVSTADADTFFTTLQNYLETLAQTQRQSPLSTELLVSSAKRFLAKPEYRIQLDDLLTQEVERLMTQLDGEDFGQPRDWDGPTIGRYVKRYEAATEALAKICGALGKWGGNDEQELPLVLEVIRSLHATAERVGDGFAGYLGLRSYPSLLIFTAYGLGLTRAGRWGTLHKLFTSKIHQKYGEPTKIVETLFLWAWKGETSDQWKHIEGYTRLKTPLSDHLLTLFLGWSKSFMGLLSDFELIFERFEILASLAYFEKEDKDSVHSSLAYNPQDGAIWMPVGRSAWHSSYAARIIAEFEAEPLKSLLVQSGFAQNDPVFLGLYFKNFKALAARIHW